MTSVLDSLFEIGKAEGFSKFSIACQLNAVHLVQDAILRGDDVNVRFEEDGTTGFYLACQLGNLDVVKYLVEHVHACDIFLQNNDGVTPFYVACENGHIDIVRLLFDRYIALGHDPFQRDMFDAGPLELACQRNQVEVARFLLEKNAPLLASQGGQTALMQAVATRSGTVVDAILRSATFSVAYLNYRRDDGITALHIAVDIDDMSITTRLLEAGALIDVLLP